jgi:hypothetical protein
MRGFFIHSHYCVIVCEVARKSFFAAAALSRREKIAYACAFFPLFALALCGRRRRRLRFSRAEKEGFAKNALALVFWQADFLKRPLLISSF